MYPVSHSTSGRLSTSHGNAIGGGVWHHPVASRRDGNDFDRIWLDSDVTLVGSKIGLVAEDDDNDGIVDLVTVG
jgi:hypothetical protein